jgi:hypothetical protein
MRIKRSFKFVFLLLLLLTQAGCVEWLHAYQTYLQMKEFDQYFAVTAKDDFTVHFKKPKLFSEDFVALAKLESTSEEMTPNGKRWRYWFRKIDKDGKVISPEVSFYCDLQFNFKKEITEWTFSKLFLQIAPPEFLEASFRSLGSAEINEDKKQLKTKAELIDKIASDLPKKAAVLKELGEPQEIKDQEKDEVYKYQFRLDARGIEEGYEKRALSEVKLTFDKSTSELIKMSGRFAGLKISINYRNYQEEDENKVASTD